jgi:hypothetical protein
LVIDFTTPLASVQLTVILWLPALKPVGGVQAQVPSEDTLMFADMTSDSTDTLMLVPAGPSPKNSGRVELIDSPSSMLLMVTLLGAVACVSWISNFDSRVADSGNCRLTSGSSPVTFAGAFLKLCVWPNIMGGTGFAAER